MQCRIFLGNHEQPLHLEDYFLLLRSLLESAGHQVDLDVHLSPGHFYIVLENFAPGSVERLQELKQRGFDFCLVATEYITGETFNEFQVPGGGNYSRQDLWQLRFAGFMQCARHARAIWCGMDDAEQLQLYQKLVPGVPVLPLPFPHCPRFPRVEHRAEKDYDLYFSGHETLYRRQVLSALHREFQVFGAHPMPEYMRQNFVARSKICLNLRQSAAWRFPSLLRYWYHLNQGSLVLSERCEVACDLDRFIVRADTAALAQACRELLAGDTWRALAAESCERFAALRPCQPAAEALLDQTFSLRV